ncbi:MAG: TMEM175 family protein [Ginsengibacter sp.]
MSSNSSNELQHAKETLRTETFSDGVFCIAVTLLSLDVFVEANKDETNEGLLSSIVGQWPIYLAYVTSFINILLAWMGHHELFKKFRNTNGSLMITNGILLMLVALVPFPTKTLGLFLLTGALKTAVIFYTGYFVLISIAFKLLWHVASRNKNLLVHGITDTQIRETTKSENIGLICNTAIMLTAFLNPWAALALSFGMWMYWIFFAK